MRPSQLLLSRGSAPDPAKGLSVRNRTPPAARRVGERENKIRKNLEEEKQTLETIQEKLECDGPGPLPHLSKMFVLTSAPTNLLTLVLKK